MEEVVAFTTLKIARLELEVVKVMKNRYVRKAKVKQFLLEVQCVPM